MGWKSVEWTLTMLPLLLLLADCQQQQKKVLVHLPQGTVAGFHVDNGDDRSKLFYGKADVFLGIPFVQPPVGSLRFQKPRPLRRFLGPAPYDASFYRPMCPQFDSTGNASMSEDCLYLNIFTPNTNQSSEKLPVMLWVHGGSLVQGSATSYHYKGAIRNLVSRGVVVVTIQYRLGMLGFFTTHSPDFPPNLGMLDQVEALRWVANNIANFGGDPKRITLFGISAGGCSVSALTYSPLSRDLIQSAIIQSGTVLTCMEGSIHYSNHTLSRSEKLCNINLRERTSGSLAKLKNCLLHMDYHNWLHLDTGITEQLGWAIVQDNYFLPGVPNDLAKGRRNIPIMTGTLLNEYVVFDLIAIATGKTTLANYTRQYFEQYFSATSQQVVGSRLPDVLKIIESSYVPPGTRDDDHLAWVKVLDKVFTGAAFSALTAREVDWWLAANNSDVFLYEFTFPTNASVPLGRNLIPGWAPVVHASEVTYIWMYPDFWTAGLQSGLLGSVDLALADWFGESWTNFAKFGTPRLDGSWKPVDDRENLHYLDISAAVYRMTPNYRHLDDVVFNRVLPALTDDLPRRTPDFNNGTIFN